MTDRRTERSWTVDVHPFDIAESVVTRELWNEVHGDADQDEKAGFPVVEVTWREDIRGPTTRSCTRSRGSPTTPTNGFTPSRARRPTPGECSTCSVGSGNGTGMCTTSTSTVPIVCSAVADGPMKHGVVERVCGAEPILLRGSMTLGSAWRDHSPRREPMVGEPPSAAPQCAQGDRLTERLSRGWDELRARSRLFTVPWRSAIGTLEPPRVQAQTDLWLSAP